MRGSRPFALGFVFDSIVLGVEFRFGQGLGDLGLVESQIFQAFDHVRSIFRGLGARAFRAFVDGPVLDQISACVNREYKKTPDQESRHGGPSEMVPAGVRHLSRVPLLIFLRKLKNPDRFETSAAARSASSTVGH